MVDGLLPEGVEVRRLSPFADARGAIVELDRMSWHPDDPSTQWTALTAASNALRGGHVHMQHADRVVLVQGTWLVALVDVRKASSTAGTCTMFELATFEVLTIPPGVVHTFYSPNPSIAINGTSHEYDERDDLEVRFDDPAFGLEWPEAGPILSPRDHDAPGADEFLARCRARGLDVVEALR